MKTNKLSWLDKPIDQDWWPVIVAGAIFLIACVLLFAREIAGH